MSTPQNTPDIELKQMIDALDLRVRESQAHNSSVYRYFEEEADLESITRFLNWDGEQPPFNVYLRHWLDKVPPCVRTALVDHIREEEEEAHSQLFRDLLDHLNSISPVSVEFEPEVLRELNYTFSAECADERDPFFFIGGFLATEIMSAKRCTQLCAGLTRLGIGREPLRYLALHSEGDLRHLQEVKERFVRPMLEKEPDGYVSIVEGVRDRLDRSSAYLRWYERHVLGRQLAS